MTHEFHDLKLGSLFGFTDDIKGNENRFSVNAGNITILWNRNKKAVEVVVDDMSFQLMPNQLMTTTYLQHISYEKTALPLTAFCLIESSIVFQIMTARFLVMAFYFLEHRISL